MDAHGQETQQQESRAKNPFLIKLQRKNRLPVSFFGRQKKPFATYFLCNTAIPIIFALRMTQGSDYRQLRHLTRRT